MNKIELLPKDIYVNDTLYQIRLWVTAFGKLCIGYKNIMSRNILDKNVHLFSVCVEPENEPISIENTIGYLNEYVGNARTLDDACDELMKWINQNKEKYRILNS